MGRRKTLIIAAVTSLLIAVATAVFFIGYDRHVPNEYSAEGDLLPRDDLETQRHVSWRSYEIVDERTIRITFDAGRCGGYFVETEESRDEVFINLYTGRIPGESGRCTLEAHVSTMLVETERPIEDRDIAQHYPRSS